MSYLRAAVTIEPAIPGIDLAVQHLSAAGWEGFEEKEDFLIAYIASRLFDESTLYSLDGLPGFKASWKLETIDEQNWNAVWESHFEPITVGKKCRIRAPFHNSERGWLVEIIVEPQMSFGTGHHDTTWLMLDELLDIENLEEPVLDMGCGTGILAMAAEKKGAQKIDAVDIETWAVDNTHHNVSLNQCVNINVEKGGVQRIRGRRYGTIFANINKNVLLKDLPAYTHCLGINGQLLLSGFFTTDIPEVSGRAAELGFTRETSRSRNNWAMLRFAKKASS